MLIQKKVYNKGFLGAAKRTPKAPYRKVERTPDIFAFGEDSAFITPPSEEARSNSPRGMKR